MLASCLLGAAEKVVQQAPQTLCRLSRGWNKGLLEFLVRVTGVGAWFMPCWLHLQTLPPRPGQKEQVAFTQLD